MRKKKKSFSEKEIRHETTNPEEGYTKFHNLIKCYPYNSKNIDFKSIPWMRDQGFSSSAPFCGIIESCQKKGYQIFSDWIEVLSRPYGFNGRDIVKYRNHLAQYLIDLIEQIDYTKQKDVLVVNNSYKELDCWFKEMYTKIGIKDNKNGWKNAYLEEVRKLNEIEESYKLYRRNKERRLKETIKKYENQKEELLKNKKNGKKFSISSFRGSPPIAVGIRPKRQKKPKNMSALEKINVKLKRYKYDNLEVINIKNSYSRIQNEFSNQFLMHVYPDDYLSYIITSKKFDTQINEIFQLIGKDWVSIVNGSLMIIGHSAEEIEEKIIFKDLQKYPRVLKNFRKARKNLLDTDWNDVPLYCCKSVERFYNILLGDKPRYKDLSLSDLTEIMRKNEEKLFKISLKAIKPGLDFLILATKNLVGTLRNKKDSGHGNPTDVEPWEAKMCYSYTLLLLRTLLNFIK